jgi:hypothetical protein
MALEMAKMVCGFRRACMTRGTGGGTVPQLANQVVAV